GRIYACFTGCIDNVTCGVCTVSALATVAAILEFTPSASDSVLTLGVGMEGRVRGAAASLPASAVTSTGAFAADLANSPACGIAPSRTIVANSMVHLSGCE